MEQYTITGIFLQTEKKEKDKTEFFFLPHGKCEWAANGRLYCIGSIPDTDDNTPCQITGTWTGKYFQTDSISILASETDQILDYIFDRSGLFLMERERKKIKKLLGDPQDLLAFLKTDAAKQKLTAAIGKEKASYLIRKSKKMTRSHDIFRLCSKAGFPYAKIDTICGKDITYEQICEDPYRLCYLECITIYEADKLAALCHITDPYDMRRVKGYYFYGIQEYKNAGDTCVHWKTLENIVNYRLGKSNMPAHYGKALLTLALHKFTQKITAFPFRREIFIYDTKVLSEEDKVISHIQRLQNASTEIIKDIDIADAEKELHFSFTEGQKQALHLIQTSGVKILTGGPGTGKTSTLLGIIHLYKKYCKGTVRLAASTGKASQVMAKATGDTAETVHKLLDIRPFEGSGKDIRNPIPADLIIIDETSMLGLEILSSLLAAVKSGSTLIFVGDKDQLQSVDCGRILQDLVDSGQIPTVELTQIMRQSGVSVKNAYRINHGIMKLETDKNFHIVNCHSEEEALQKLMKNLTLDNLQGTQVMTTVKKGICGVWNLNDSIREKLPKPNACIRAGQYTFYTGDRIIMTKTNYASDYFNGEVGIITDIHACAVNIRFDDRSVRLEKPDLRDMMPAYAVTIHKSQGSEYDIVHILLPDNVPNMLTRRILYTAVTRGKKEIYIYSINNSHITAIGNTQERKRLTLLGKRLEEKFNG